MYDAAFANFAVFAQSDSGFKLGERTHLCAPLQPRVCVEHARLLQGGKDQPSTQPLHQHDALAAR